VDGRRRLEGICCAGGQVKLFAWIRRVGQHLSTLCEDVTYPRREYLKWFSEPTGETFKGG
jgi:hypothetical protein